jgi:transposase
MISGQFAGDRMKRFVEGTDRGQSTLFPECLEDWIGEDNPVRVIDVFVEELDLGELGFDGVAPEATGRPSYHPAVLLKLYIYGYLNRVQSSRRLEREAGHNVEVMWLTGRLAPDHKTIADFRKDNGSAIRQVCTRFVTLCRTMGLLTQASVAIDGSKFKAVNNRDRNFTRAKMERRMAQIEESVARYLQQLDTADRQEPSEALKTRTSGLKDKIEKLKQEMRRLTALKADMLATPNQQISLTDPDARSMATSGRGSGVVGYNVQIAGVSSTGRRNTPHWSAPTVGAEAISPLRAKTLDTALVPSSGSGVIRQYWQLFQPSQRFAFSCGMNRVRACPSICMPFQRGGLE